MLRRNMNRGFLGSWKYFIAASLVFYVLARLAFSFIYVEHAHVFMRGNVCAAALANVDPEGSCQIVGRTVSGFDGQRWLIPDAQPDVKIRLSDRQPIAYLSDTESGYPGGMWVLDSILLVGFLGLYGPYGYALIHKFRAGK